MHLRTIAIAALIIAMTHALFISSSPSINLLPSLNITIPHLNATKPNHLGTDVWPPAPYKVWLEETHSYILIQSIVTRPVPHTDYDESVCDSIQDIIHLKFGRKSKKKAYVDIVREVNGHVSFTLRPLREAVVMKEEIVTMLWQFWWGTSEFGAATLWGSYYSFGVEAAEFGLLLN